ncbi:hypothetical protein RUND412_009171 [Rhizina undulata]
MPSTTTDRFWLITGAGGTGFGHNIALHALNQGDKVIAASRKPEGLTALKKAGTAPLKLDQNGSFEEIKKAVEEAIEIYGKIDIIVLNAARMIKRTFSGSSIYTAQSSRT